MGRKSYKQQAIEFGEEYAEQFFTDFQDPIYHGPNFTWDKFPDMVKRMAYLSCGLSSLFWEEKTKRAPELRMICGEAARAKAEELIFSKLQK